MSVKLMILLSPKEMTVMKPVGIITLMRFLIVLDDV